MNTANIICSRDIMQLLQLHFLLSVWLIIHSSCNCSQLPQLTAAINAVIECNQMSYLIDAIECHQLLQSTSDNLQLEWRYILLSLHACATPCCGLSHLHDIHRCSLLRPFIELSSATCNQPCHYCRGTRRLSGMKLKRTSKQQKLPKRSLAASLQTAEPMAGAIPKNRIFSTTFSRQSFWRPLF